MPCTRVDTRAELGATDHVDWATLGPSRTPVVAPRQGQSADGAWYVLTQPLHMVRLRQGRDAAATWVGNFAAGDAVLATSLDPGAITIRFPDKVRGAGAQVQPADLPGSEASQFVARIVALGADGTVLGDFEWRGESTNANDGSAIFIGVRSDALEIVSLNISVAWQGEPDRMVDLGINRLDIGGR
jgi:hypothetical protein